MKKACFVIFFVALIGAAAALIWATLTVGKGWGGDSAGYIMQARSLVEMAPSSFVEANRFTIEQSCNPPGPVAYPWGFPLLLAPLYAIFGLDLFALKAVGALSYLLFLVVLWMGFRRVHSIGLLFCLVGLLALNPVLLKFSDKVASDFPFLFLATLSVVLMGKVVVEGKQIMSFSRDHLLLGLLIAAAFLIRTVGIVLLVTLAASQIISRLRQRGIGGEHEPRRKTRMPTLPRALSATRRSLTRSALIPLMPYAVFLVTVVVWKWILPEGGDSYLDELRRASLETIGQNLFYYVKEPAQLFSPVPLFDVVYGATIPLAVGGMMRRCRSDYHAIVYVLVMLLVLVIWPYKGLRFLFPLAPFYLSFVITGLETFQGGTTGAERVLRRIVCYVPVLLVVFYFGKAASLGAYHNMKSHRLREDGPFAASSQRMLSFVAERTSPRSTIVFFKPRTMSLMTGRRSIRICHTSELSHHAYIVLFRRGHPEHQVPRSEVLRLISGGSARLVYKDDMFLVVEVLAPELPPVLRRLHGRRS